MAKIRTYKLMCPIARGLDRIGDRWTLLILRDLHAGPARFSELQYGLTGIAANLLTDRLAKLMTDGLVLKEEGNHGIVLYALSELGEKTRDILFDLAMFGGRFPPLSEPIDPGNLRTIAVTLGTACQRVVTCDMDFIASMIVDGEQFSLDVKNGDVRMLYQSAKNPDIVLETTYSALLRLAEGEMDMGEFSRHHAQVDVRTPGKDAEFTELISQALMLFVD